MCYVILYSPFVGVRCKYSVFFVYSMHNLKKLFQQAINNCESPVLFGLSEGRRGVALSHIACAVSLRTLYRGGSGARGAEEGRQEGTGGVQ